MIVDGPARYTHDDAEMGGIMDAGDRLLEMVIARMPDIVPGQLPQGVMERQAVAHMLGAHLSAVPQADAISLMEEFLDAMVTFEKRARAQFDPAAVAGRG